MYAPVTQFETRKLQADAQSQLARERNAAAALARPRVRRRLLARVTERSAEACAS